jgi:platelet-activating factor acetylhydrolase IB subunit alpha
MEEASVDPEEAAKTATGILEKKWISVAKLMLQVKDQQKQIEELSSSLNPVLSTGGGGTVSGLPRAPAKYILSGHRKNVTKVAFHPTYSLIATAS